MGGVRLLLERHVRAGNVIDADGLLVSLGQRASMLCLLPCWASTGQEVLAPAAAHSAEIRSSIVATKERLGEGSPRRRDVAA
jgi:hypothetical protein